MKLKLFAIAVLALLASFGSQAFGQSINATSFPSGVEVFVDGVDTNTVTPSVIKTTAGNHTVLFSAPSGYVSVTETVSVTDKVVPVNAVLLPVLLQGPVGPQGPQGVQGATGATGAQGPSGPAGRSPFQGIWTSSSIFQIGDEGQSSFNTSGGPVGMFFNLTGLNQGDPWADNIQNQFALALPADWIYCCGTLPTPSAAATATLTAAINPPPPPPPPQPQAGTFSGTATLTPTNGCSDFNYFSIPQNISSASGTITTDASNNITASTGIGNGLSGSLANTVILTPVSGAVPPISFSGNVVWGTGSFSYTGSGTQNTGCTYTLTLQFNQ